MSRWPTSVLINDFATRCFRETADRDYVQARLAYRAGLIPQFLWSSLHCLEKYAKCILLLNRVRSTKVKHEVSGSLRLLAERGPFTITLSAQSNEFVRHLEENGAEFRYFEVSYWSTGHDIVKLDRAVWELRRYCQILDHDPKTNARSASALEQNLKRVREAVAKSQNGTCITGGWLEQVIEKRKHPAREPLLWKNLFFGPSRRKRVSLQLQIETGNSPLYLHPEIVDEVAQCVYIPKPILAMWREEAARRMRESNRNK